MKKTDLTAIPSVTMIAAVDRKFGLGCKGRLLCSLPKDLARFKSLTQGHILIMRRITFLSLPKSPLPNREHIVLTGDAAFSHPGVHTASDPLRALETAGRLIRQKGDGKKKIFVIGGAMVYDAFLKTGLTDTILLTHIEETFAADAFFPALPPEWRPISEELIPEEGYETRFVTYKRDNRLSQK